MTTLLLLLALAAPIVREAGLDNVRPFIAEALERSR